MSGGSEESGINVQQDYVTKLMVSAVREGNLVNVKKLVESHGLSCCEADNVGNSLISNAIKFGHIDIAKYLLHKGVRVEPEADGADTLLHLVIKQRSFVLVPWLLKNRVRMDARNAENETPLHLAAKNGYRGMVRALLDSNASVTAQTTEGATPLLLAVEGRHGEVVEMLFKHASAKLRSSARKNDSAFLNRVLLCNPSTRERVDNLVVRIVTQDKRQSRIVEELADHGFIPSRGYVNKALLSAAVKKNYVKFVRNILMSDYDLGDLKHDPSLLHSAVENANKEVVELLLSSGFDANAKNKEGKTCLRIIFDLVRAYVYNRQENECAEMIRMLLTRGADIKEVPLLLLRAVENGLVEVCKVLIDNGAHLNALNADGQTPLYVSCDGEEGEKRDKIVRFLLEKGADGNIKCRPNSWTALHLAVRWGRKETVSILIQFGVDVDPLSNYNYTPLYLASRQGCKDIVQMLCENRASVDARDKYGQTPLHGAAFNGKADVVEVLIEFGADINARGNDGSTALHKACDYGDKNTVKMLCENGASVDSRRNDGLTSLHVAAYNGNADAVEVLLSFGADTNARVAASGAVDEDNNGCTPLHIAAKRNLTDVVKTLVKFGCDVDARGPNNETALHCAFSGDCDDGFEWNAEIVTTLINEGCDVNAIDCDGNTALDCAISKATAYYEKMLEKYVHDDYLYLDEYLDSNSLEAIEALKRHLIKLKAAGFHVRDIKQELSEFDYSAPAHSEFQTKCEEELNRLKSERVSPDHTFFDILVSNTNSFFSRLLLSDELLVQSLSSFDFDPFPIYKNLIAGKLRQCLGQAWLNTLARTSKRLNEYEYSVLPVELLERIVSYLSNSDITNLIACGQALKCQVSKQEK